MNDYYTRDHNTISFQQICLQHYKRILEIATKEFTVGYWNYVTQGNIVNKSYETDKRKEFSQAVEIMADALYPHFDKKMKVFYTEHEKAMEGDEKEEKVKKKTVSEDNLKLNKLLFRELSCLLHRLDYFKTVGYTEGGADDFGEEVELDDTD